jgi:hypothetical protein
MKFQIGCTEDFHNFHALRYQTLKFSCEEDKCLTMHTCVLDVYIAVFKCGMY